MPAPAPEAGAYAATFGSGIHFVEHTVRSLEPESLMVQLQWRAVDEQSVDWTVFVHALDSEGTLVGQHDGRPDVGFRPTSTWRQGETIFDTHLITLAQGARLEELVLSIGLYDPATGERQRLLGEAEPADAFNVAAGK